MTKTSPKTCKYVTNSLIRLFLASMILLMCTDGSNAEGTKQTTETSSDYTHLFMNASEYNNFGRYDGTEDQRLFIHIEDPENEVVYFGFSRFYNEPHWPNTGGSRDGYFRIKDPSGNVVWPTAGDPNGQLNNFAISTWQQAVNGPNQIVGSGGYNAYTFNPDGLPAGDYYIEFSRTQDAFDSREFVIPYYDITVATESGTPTAIDGRVFSYNWAFMCPAIDYPNDFFDRDFTGSLYIYSDDGFVNLIDFSDAEFRGAAFNIAFNSSGTSATGDFEVDRASVQDDNVTFAEYRVFLNNPDETAFTNGVFGEFVVNADFPKLYGCPDDNEWFFRFAATEPGRVEVLLDANSNGEFDPGTADRIFTEDVIPFPGETSPYLRDIPWDGLDGLGNQIPTGTPITIDYRYSQGFYHLPVYDVERLNVGFDVTPVRPATPQPYDPDFFYDDEAIDESLPGGQPALQLDGCTPTCHNWTNVDYGNFNTINTFWYAYRSQTTVTVPFETPPPTCAGCPFVPFAITGRVVLDIDEDGLENGADYGFSNVTVNVYEDANGNGVYNPGTDPLIDSDITDANGDYSLIGQIATDHLIVINGNSLPIGSTLTTNGLYEVQFSSLYDADCDGLFGFVVYPVANTDFDTVPDTSIPIVIEVQRNDEDPLGGGVTTSLVTPPTNGSSTVTGDDITYTAIPGFIGVDSLQYEICSPEGLCDTAWVYIQVGDICDDGIDNDGDGIIDNYSPQIVLTATGVDPYCVGFSDGSISVSATGGRAPFTYSWIENGTPFSSSRMVMNLGEGTYIVTVEDANGCKESESVTLTAGNCPPIANNDFNNTFVNTPVPGNVLINDIDLNGDNIAVSSIPPLTPPSNGTVTINPNGSYFYTPNPGFEGDDSFQYVMCDDGTPSLCDTATAYIEVLPLTADNDPPIANADAAQTLVDVPVSGNVLVNDDDPDGDVIILNLNPIVPPSNGSVTLLGNGTFTYIPNPGFQGTDTFIYSICDDQVPSLCDTAVVTINVIPDSSPYNNPPVAANDGATTNVDTPVSGDLLGNDSDPDGDDITVNTTPVSDPTNGTVTINPDGTFDYTPDPGFVGTDVFTYEICDDGTPSLCDVADVTIVVVPDNPGNQPPVAQNDEAQTPIDTPVSSSVIPNDGDPDGDPLTVNTTPVVDPINGTVVLQPNGDFTYTPNPGFTGTDEFVYSVCDDGTPVLCDEATVVITVTPNNIPDNDPPFAGDDGAITDLNTPVGGQLLTNDFDPNGDNITVNTTPIVDPTNGSVTINPNGTFVYTPNTDYSGPDQFVYEICDDGTPSLCAQATVYITVLPRNIVATADSVCINDVPYINYDVTPVDFASNGPVDITFLDPQGNVVATYTNQPLTGQILWPGAVVDGNGNGLDWPGWVYANGAWSQEPDGFEGLIPTATIVFSVNPTDTVLLGYPPASPFCNPRPPGAPVAVNDFNNTLVNTPVGGNVLTNDYDLEGNNLTANGTLVTNPVNGSVVLNPDGSYTYTPNTDYIGEDFFTYVMCNDAPSSLCDTAIVFIEVAPVSDGSNNPPIANPDAYVTLEDVPVNGQILSNDFDPDNDNIILNTTPISGPLNGSITINANGTFTYTPDPGFIGEDVIVYEICDDGTPSLCDTSNIVIDVIPDPNGPNNDPPFAGDDAAYTPVNVPVSGQLLPNDYDPNGDNIVVNTTQISGPSNGSVVINPDGSFTYTPNTDFIGPDQFVYEICDDVVPPLCAQATAYITVYPGPEMDFTITEPLCNGDADGSIDITVSNAVEPYTYSWSNGATTEDLTNVAAGTYVVTVTDALGSVVQATIELTQPPVLTVVVDVQDETIVNGCNGSATANATGGAEPYTYLWSDGQTTQTATGLCAGIYQVTITDANGCDVTTSNVINPPSCDLDVNVTGTSVDCNGGADGTVLATPITQQNNTPFTYLWNNGATTQQLSAVSAGPYSVTVTDGIGCTASGTFVVTEPPLLTVSTTVVDEQNFQACDGSATASAAGGTPPYVYSWSDGQVGQTASDLCPGTYIVTITDANGCTASRVVTVNEISCSGYSVSINTYSLSCFQENDGAAVAVVSGGTGPFTYFWTTGGATTDSISNLGAGTYEVIVTDNVGCEQTVSGVVTQPALLNAATAVDPVTCHGLGNGAIELTVTGGTTPYTFAWSNGATTEDLNNLGPGTYGVTVTDANGCTANTSGAVTEPDTLGASSIDTDATCFGGSDASIDLTATGGLPPYQFSWSTGATTEDIFGLAAGSYTVTFVDQNACVFEYTTTVGEANEFEPEITANGPTTFCDGDDVVLTATSGATYLWSTGETTQSITVTTSGVYTVNVVTADGCAGDTDPVQVTVNSNPNPTVSPVGPTTFCDGGSVTLTTGSFASYLWSTGETTQSITVDASGDYSVTVTDGNGCEGTSGDLTVTVNDLPSPTVTAGGPTEFCDGGSVTLTASAASSYVWSNGETTQSITVSSAGTFTVTVTDANGCEGTSAPVTTTVFNNPTPTITAGGPTIFCDGDSVVLTASDADDYLWSTGETTQSITVFASGTFTVTVTDANDCSGTSAPVEVVVNTNPIPTISTSGPTEFCFGDSVVLTSSLADTYLWNTGATTRSITVFSSGEYAVTATLASGCSGTSDTTIVTVNSNPTPTITADGSLEFCDGEDVVLTASSGSSYLWSTGSMNPSITVASSGEFWVTVSNGDGCVGTSDTVEVIVNPLPNPTIEALGPTEFCDGDSVQLRASGGDSYLWSTGETTSEIYVSTSGTYTVTATDANGCVATSAPITIVVNELPFSFIFATGPTTFCDGDSVDLVARESEAYLWTTGDTTRIITVTTSGTYSVTTFDANGCASESNEITVTVNPNPAVTINAGGPLAFCDGGDVTLTADLTAPTPISYTWSTGETTASIDAETTGSYWVSVVDGNGCAGESDTVDVEVWDLPEPEVTTVGVPSFCAGDTIFLTTTEEYESYLWTNNGDTTRTTFALQTGFYTVLVTDTNGCQALSPENLITVNVVPNPTTTPDGTVEICDGDTLTITSVMAESYLWSTGDTTQAIQVTEAGIYNIAATDQNGCVGTSADVTVIVNTPPSPTITADNDLDFCLGGDVTLSTGDYESYQWSTGANTQSITVNQSGTYTVTVTDSVGCSAASAQADVTVYQPPVVDVNVTGPQQFCFGDSAVLTATPGYNSYLWSNGATTESITVFTSGSFTVTVLDENGCEGTSQLVTIEVYDLPNADIIAGGPLEFCDGESVTITATGGQDYVWSTGATTNSITVSSAGSYYVVADNQFGCIDTSASVNVLINNPPTITVFPDGPTEFCDGGSVTLVVSGADTYVWSTGETGTAITVNATGLYSATGTDANGCDAQSGNVAVTVFDDPVPTITADGPTEFCAGDTVILTSSEATSYLWNTGATTQSITVTTSGSFEVSVVDSNGCEGLSARTIVEVFTNPTPTISANGPTEFCDGDSVILTASGAVSYLWSTGETTQAIVVSTSGDYSVEVTDQNGCVGESSDVTITVFDNPEPVITASDTVTCDGQTNTLISSDAESYLWSTGATSQQIAVTTSGVYVVEVTDLNGCTGTADVEITVNPTPDPVPVITPDGPTTFCDGDSVILSVDNWDSYLWSPNGDTTQHITVTESGLYVVTVTNEFGCEADATGVVVTVNTNPEPVVVANGDSAICEGETILLTTGFFNTYEWSTGDTTQTISVDTTGSYTVTVTNGFGCESISDAYEVVANPLPEISIAADGPTTICEGDSVTLNAVGDGPYLWNTGDTTQSIVATLSGTYYVQASDTVTGCIGVSDDIEVEYVPAFNPEITVDGNTAFCDGDSVLLTASEGLSYEWSTAETTQSIWVSSTGVYTVMVVDANGCSGEADETITALPQPQVEIVPGNQQPYCDGDEVVLLAVGGNPFEDSIEWSTGDTTGAITVTETNVYSVTITNPQGCSASDATPIAFIPLPPAEIFVNGESTICEGDEVDLVATGPPGGWTYEWNTGATTQTITVTEAGNYSVTVTGLSGCSNTSDDVAIGVVPAPTVDAGDYLTICIGDSVTLSLVSNTGENILWTPGGSFESITVAPQMDTMYVVEISNPGCDVVALDTVIVYVQDYPTANFGYGNTYLGEPVEFTDSSEVPPLFSWDWNFGDGNFSSDQNPAHNYEAPGEYEVSLVVSTSGGCTDTATEVIDVQEFFVITNVLTPNGDGINDYIWVTSSLADIIETKVYNRWGFSVWEGAGTDLKFEGRTTGGVDLEAGTYYYVIQVNYGEKGSQDYTGYITLIR